MLGRTGVAHYGRRCSWAHSEGHIGVAHYGILVGGPLQLRWQPIGRRCLWAHLGEVPTRIIKVSKSGGGNLDTVMAAVDSVPPGNTQRVIIMIGGGVFEEKIKIDRNKPFITFYGLLENMPVLSFDGTAAKFGTVDSATLIVESDYFMAVNIIVMVSQLVIDTFFIS